MKMPSRISKPLSFALKNTAVLALTAGVLGSSTTVHAIAPSTGPKLPEYRAQMCGEQMEIVAQYVASTEAKRLAREAKAALAKEKAAKERAKLAEKSGKKLKAKTTPVTVAAAPVTPIAVPPPFKIDPNTGVEIENTPEETRYVLRLLTEYKMVWNSYFFRRGMKGTEAQLKFLQARMNLTRPPCLSASNSPEYVRHLIREQAPELVYLVKQEIPAAPKPAPLDEFGQPIATTAVEIVEVTPEDFEKAEEARRLAASMMAKAAYAKANLRFLTEEILKEVETPTLHMITDQEFSKRVINLLKPDYSVEPAQSYIMIQRTKPAVEQQ